MAMESLCLIMLLFQINAYPALVLMEDALRQVVVINVFAIINLREVFAKPKFVVREYY